MGTEAALQRLAAFSARLAEIEADAPAELARRLADALRDSLGLDGAGVRLTDWETGADDGPLPTGAVEIAFPGGSLVVGPGAPDRQLLELAAAQVAQAVRCHRAERGWKLSDERYRVLTEVSPQVVWLAEADGHITYCNQWWYDYTGLTPEETEGQGWTQAIHPDHRERLREAWLEAAGTGSSWNIEIPFRRAADGEFRWHLAKGLPVRGADGRIGGWAGVAVDIHDRVMAEQAVRLSDERKSAILQSAIDCIVTMDHHGCIVDFNPAAERTFGCRREQAVGRLLADVLIPPRLREAHAAGFARYLATGEHHVLNKLLELPAWRADGSEFPVEISITAAAPTGGPPFFTAFLRDITERKRADDALRESETKFRTLSEVVPVMVWACRPDGTLLHANHRWTSYTGQTEAEYAGFGWTDILHPEDRDHVIGLWQHSVRTGENYIGEARYRRHDGAFRWHHFRGMPLLDAEGGITGWYGTSLDVHESKESELALKEARSRLESTLVAGEIGTWEFDLVHNTVRADANLARIFSVDAADTDNGPLEAYTRAIHPDDLPAVLAEIGRAIEAGGQYECTYRVTARDGGIRWVVARGRVERDEHGRAVRMPGVVVDITAQRLAETELQATRERWRLALEAAEMGVWNIDVDTREMQADERFRMIFRGTTEPMTLEEGFQCLHPDDRERVRVALEASMQPTDPVPYAEEYRVVHPDGKILWVQGKGRANYEPTADGSRLRSLDGTVSDITERKLAEERLREFAARLSEADRRKDEFLATLAHELRNPLTPIRTGLEVMRLAAGDTARIEGVRSMMETQVRQLVRLIDDLLDVSRITSGKIVLRTSRIDLADAVASAVDATRTLIDDAGLELAVEMPDEPVILEADAARLSQVFTNLLTNAVRYTDRGGRIVVAARREGGSVLATVRDNGIGIPAEMAEGIFEMFTQVDRSLERSQGGLGIGLTLVRRLTELHGGTVEVVSGGLGLGSEFRVRLPLAPAENPAPAEPAAPVVDAPAACRKVLVVDDNHAAAEMLSLAVSMLGHDVRTAFDGAQAIELAEDFRPDVVLMDVGMPKMDGCEAARTIRSHEWGRAMVLVALTGWGQKGDKQRTHEAGFDHHLVKPAEPAVLRELLAAVPAGR